MGKELDQKPGAYHCHGEGKLISFTFILYLSINQYLNKMESTNCLCIQKILILKTESIALI